MAQYIDKDALVAKIEKSVEWFFENNDRIYDEYGNYYYKNGDNDYRFYQNFAEGGWNENRLTLSEMAEVYLDINSLEVKEVDLEKEAERFVQTKEFIESTESPVIVTAKHFFKLGLKAQKGEKVC